jgi:hypothetical protein
LGAAHLSGVVADVSVHEFIGARLFVADQARAKVFSQSVFGETWSWLDDGVNAVAEVLVG